MMPSNLENIKLSVVIPVYSGAAYLESLAHQLDALRSRWIGNNAPISLSEAIFVDDAAIDNSLAVLNSLSEKYPWITLLSLSRNFGQHPATEAGILYTSGDWVVTLDEDLQHPPALIEALLIKAVTEHCDIVYANPKQAVHQNLIRDWGSRYYKRMITRLAGIQSIPLFNSYRLIRGNIARAASSVCSHDTYLDIALCWFTERIGVVRTDLKDQRLISSGKSGYSLQKLMSHARRMILSTQTKALRFGGLLGILTFILSLSFGSFFFLNYFFGWMVVDVQGWASIVIISSFLGGLSLLLISIMIEYISIILLHTQGKPTFFVVDRSKDKLLLDYFTGQKDADPA
jgi:glycosyltransferase involved in cell wall biosynthesis